MFLRGLCGRLSPAAQCIDGLLDHGGVIGQVDGRAPVAALFQGGDGSIALALRSQEQGVVVKSSGCAVLVANLLV